MKKVLIISPHWPPVALPDMHRVRMALPYLAEFGWEPLILKVKADAVDDGLMDTRLLETIPPGTKIWRAGYIPRWCTHWLGINSPTIRGLLHIFLLGNKIIKQEKPDLIFFSTSMFFVLPLGRIWKKKFGIPYVIDFQDPWWSDYQGDGTNFYRTWKYKAAMLHARMLEPWTMRHVSHVVSISPGYVDILMRRYRWLTTKDFKVISFGSADADFEHLKKHPAPQAYFDPKDGKHHWVYAGRVPASMSLALRALFLALKTVRERDPEKVRNLRLHFLGTDYASGKRALKTVTPLAIEYGVQDLVEEREHRIPYLEALQCVLDAQALLTIGSDDFEYAPSKIATYIKAGKPLLAIFHERSNVVDLLRDTTGGTLVTFNLRQELATISDSIIEKWFATENPPMPHTNQDVFSNYSAYAVTKALCSSFERALQFKETSFE